MTETELLNDVIDLAHYLGAKVAHFRPARTAKGWATPVQGDGKGFPDLLILTADNRVMVRELKSATGRLTAEQLCWLTMFGLSGIDSGIWRPRDWPDRIKTELSPARSTNGVA